MEKKLVQVSETEVKMDFQLNCKCRAIVRLKSLTAAFPIAFKIQTSSPQKFLVNPPSGLIPPLSFTTFQIILKPQTQLPPTFPRSPTDRFLVKTAPFTSAISTNHPNSLNSWFLSLPPGSTQDLKLKVAFVGLFLLRHGVSLGDVESVKNIIKRQKGILSELSQQEAESLLRVATELDTNEAMVNLLLEAGLKIDARVETESVGLYPQPDSKWESKGWSELHVAVANGRTEEVLQLVKGFGPLDLGDKERRTPLHLAAGRGNIRCAKALVESGASKDARSKDGRTALHRAAANGDRKMVEMLIEMGADPTIRDDHGRSAIDVARDKGHEEVVEILECGELVLRAARGGELQRVESLLRRGASTKYSDQYGLTALHAAAIKGKKDVVLKLKEFGADLECHDNEGHTPLHLAVEGGSLDTVEALVERGANVNAKTKLGATPLSIAKALAYDEISQFLISREASS